MRVFKFGGASVRDADGIRNVGSIVKSYAQESLVVVVSAIGKTTNELEVILDKAWKQLPYEAELQLLIEKHKSICAELSAEEEPPFLEYWILKLKNALAQPGESWHAFYDLIISFGELISTTIVQHHFSKFLPAVWEDARDHIKTNSTFTEGEVDWEFTQHLISTRMAKLLKDQIVVTQGFIGSDLSGQTTTLGREGSDFSGAIFAACLRAESLTVWKDVPGLLNADPKKIEAPELFDELSFREVTELTYYGAKVIHPKTIRPLAQHSIPLYVKSFVEPSGAGTKISESARYGTRHCFVFKENQILVTLHVKDNSFMDEKKMVRIFQKLDEAHIKMNMMQISALTFTFCMDANEYKLEAVRERLQEYFVFKYNSDLKMATVKNPTVESMKLLPEMEELILEQRTRNTLQMLYKA